VSQTTTDEPIAKRGLGCPGRVPILAGMRAVLTAGLSLVAAGWAAAASVTSVAPGAAGAAPPSAPAPLSLPAIADVPGSMLLVWLVFVVTSWWLVYLVFSGAGRGDEERLAEPDVAPVSDSAADAGPDAAADAGPDATADAVPATRPRPAHWGDDPSPVGGDEPEQSRPPDSVSPADLAALEKVEQRLSACHDVEAALDEAVRAVREEFGLPAAAAWTGGLADPAAGAEAIGEFSPRACRHAGLWDADGSAAPDTEVFAPWSGALGAGEAVCIPDCAAEPDLAGRLRPGVGALVLAPFPSPAGLRGALAVAWPAALAVGGAQFALARRLGAVVGLAADRARLRQELDVRRSQARVLVETGLAASGAADLQATLDGILHVVHGRLSYPACAIMLFDDTRRELRVASLAGYERAVLELRVPADGPSVTATAAREQRVVNVPDVAAWPGYIAGSATVRSELAIPLAADGETFGVLDVESEQAAAFGVRDRITLEAVASQAALVLAHARLVGELRERASRLQAADEMARAVSTTLDAHSLFHIVVEQVRATVGSDRATMVVFDEEAGQARVVALSSAQPVEGSEVGRTVPLAELSEDEQVARGVVYIPEVDAAGAPRSSLRGTGFHSVVRVPIHIDGRVVGVFTTSSLQPGAFTRAQVATLEAVAPHVSAALRNARLYEQVERSYQRLNEAHVHLVQSEQLRVLGEMASGVAHNFNNVLGAILGRAQLVRARVGDPRLAQEIAVIEQAATDGAATVRRLQEFTRVRTDREFAGVDLSQVARDALALTRPWWKDRAEAAGVTYAIASDLTNGVWVDGQAHELREVAMNVLINAVEAMPNGGSLTVRTRAAGQRVMLEIADTGVGMSDEVRSRIFHPFYSTKGPRGTGLGLSIAYGIVRRHGGELDVESALGRGTTVRLTLPAGSASPAAPPAAAPELTLARFRAQVLVVEDEPAIASLLEELLTDSGYGVAVARSGREAVERLVEASCDLVLTDLGMPEMSGWELARHCRDLYPGLPVVLVTGWGVELDGELVAETAVRGVISKPFAVGDVLDMIARVLEDADPAAERQAA
jgi:signal transduction histidine kinase/ActR/RegA family two-component response regulator